MSVARASARRRTRAATLWGTLCGLAILGAAAGLMLGYAPYGPGEVLSALFGFGDETAVAIVREVRAPRVLLALLIGAGLGVAGAALQGLLRNPLAEPGLLGVSASAGFGAVLAFHFGALGTGLAWRLPFSAMLGALVATTLLLLIARRSASGLTLILSGVAISSLAVALTSLALNLAPNPFALSEMLLWLLGSVKDRSMDHVLLILPFLILGSAVLLATARGLDALSLGEETAVSLGVDLRRLRVLVVIGVALIVGAAVSVSGGVGFVGLVVPHMLRPFVGHEPSRLLAPSALGGAALLAIADVAARVSPTNQEVMLGVVTALIGAPFFLWLVLRLEGRSP